MNDVSPQLQPFLPGMGDSSAIGKAVRAKKLPHQMTPDEFAAAPNAVFHSTHLSPEHVLNMENRRDDFETSAGFSPHLHVGSEQAAIENAARTENDGVGRVVEGAGVGTERARLHTYWYHPQPGDSTEVHHDGWSYTRPEYRAGSRHKELWEIHDDYDPDSNRAGDFDPKYEYSHDLHPFPAVLYDNSGEDYGSLSISINDPSRLKTQGDYVRHAIAQGKGDEVHPKTMAMFKAGHLDNGAVLPEGFANRVSEANNGGVQYTFRDNGRPHPFKFDNDSGMSAEDTRKWEQDSDVPDAPKTRYSEFGPKLEAIKKMARKKR